MTCFLPVPVDGQKATCHGEAVKWYQVPIDGRAVSCHDETVEVTSKKQGTNASAGQPKDAVPGDETVRVPQYLINGIEFKSIDVGAGYKTVMGWLKALN